MEFFVMERVGHFKPHKATSNQCKGVGHHGYNYTCKIVFDPTIRLDSRGFLIDHQDVDDAIRNIKHAGSCEEMHQVIMKTILTTLERKRVDPMAVKVVITPIDEMGRESAMAKLTNIFVKDHIYMSMVA